MTGAWWAYLVVFAYSAFTGASIALVTTCITGRLNASGSQDKRAIRVPRLDSGAIAVAFVTAVLFSSLLSPLTGRRGELDTVLIVAVAVFLAGVLGEFQQRLPSWYVGAEIAGAILVWSVGIGIGFLDTRVLNILVTIIWFIVIINAFKALDGIVGLSPGIATINCLTLFALSLANGQILLAVLSIGLAGSTIGFLGHTLFINQSTIGKSGSQFIGFMIAFLALQLEGRTIALVPILSCSFVIINFVLIIASRQMGKHGLSHATQGGIGHILLDLGLRKPSVLSSLYLVAGLIGVLSFLTNRLSSASGFILSSLVILTLSAIGAFLLRVSIRKYNQNTNSSLLNCSKS